MLLQLSPEHRSIAKQKNMITEVPSGTPAHIVARLVAGIVAFCEKRSITAAEERSYQSAAARYVRPQSDIQSQIAAWNHRQAAKRKTVGDVRSLAAGSPELSLEDLSRCLRLQYSEDTINQLRLAAITKQIRQGGGFGVGAPLPRYEPGSSQDPTASLRDDDAFDFEDDDSWDQDEHQRCATFHRSLAQKSSTWQRGAAHHAAADLHSRAAAGGDSRAARAASKELL
jgi:hypothetical protein